jgi:hypothetical protein
MKTAWIEVVAAMAAVSLSGCGTICNFAHGDPDICGAFRRTWSSSRSLARQQGVG